MPVDDFGLWSVTDPISGPFQLSCCMRLHLHPENPQARNLQTIREILVEGGVIVYPTDTIYGLGCDIHQYKAIERVCRIKQVNPAKAQLTFICYDLSQMSDYTKSISTPLYRMLKTHLPGPYTFILPASKKVPRIFHNKKNTIGLRVPDNRIAQAIVKELGHPIVGTSLPGQLVEDYTDPELIEVNFDKLVDVVVDGGMGGVTPSTVIDCTGEEPIMIRAGLGKWDGAVQVL
jgi:tRNA threonylcarbamoyl adenosine modification protein (Sua5/YciO/YrdC/YwlC family)